MILECSECLAVVEAERAPTVCPSCGMAGAMFCFLVEDERSDASELGVEIELCFDVPPALAAGGRP